MDVILRADCLGSLYTIRKSCAEAYVQLNLAEPVRLIANEDAVDVDDYSEDDGMMYDV